MIFDLPTSLEVNGTEYRVRSDFRDVMRVLEAFEDVELDNREKEYICLKVIFVDCDDIPTPDLPDAYQAALNFIDGGRPGTKKNGPRTMDWTQDAPLIFPAVNKVAGCEVRSVDYMHWWTFLGYFQEMKDTTYATVLSLRHKKAKGKKLEKWEKEFWNGNKDICQIRTRLSAAEEAEAEAEKQRLLALL